AANFLATGLDPMPMKLTNLILHLINGFLLFLLGTRLIGVVWTGTPAAAVHAARVSAVAAGGWMLLPINLTPVLYVVQRMESLSHFFVLAGLLIYLHARVRMPDHRGTWVCAASLLVMTTLGVLAKESAVLLPLYAVTMEWLVLGGFRRGNSQRKSLVVLYGIFLIAPMILGLAWLAPGILNPDSWARRDFGLYERLLSEGRVVLSYIEWTVLPLPGSLAFYHDDFTASTGLLAPWSTLPSLVALAGIALLGYRLRNGRPLFALGVAWFFSAHLLTATVLPLELVFEHRNYFASYGVVLVLMTSLLPLARSAPAVPSPGAPAQSIDLTETGRICAALLLLTWAGFTAMSASIWGNPLRLGLELEARAPNSPRAQYEIGKTYLIYSGYQSASPFSTLATRAFEASMQKSPKGSILPEQALVFMASRMGLPIEEQWWSSMLTKLHAAPASVEDEGAIATLARCARDHICDLPKEKMLAMFSAALGHPEPSAILYAAYGDYAWNVLDDKELGLRLAEVAAQKAPKDPVYLITHIKMLAALSRGAEATAKVRQLMQMPGWNDSAAVERALRANARPMATTPPAEAH
ncbi:MAG TPA: hypothetical protein VGE56_08190, partial [Rhodocyclaceae bacterium]